MTFQSVKRDIATLKESIYLKKETPWDCKCLMLQFNTDMTRRIITKKLYEISGEHYEEPGPVKLSYSNFDPLSQEAREFLALSDEDKMKAVETEFPPRHISDEEAVECKRRFMEKLSIMGDRLDATTT